MDDVASRVIQAIAKTQHLPVEQVSIDQTFEELKMDSLDGINLLFELESEFHIDIPEEQAREIRSVRAMVDGVKQLIAMRGALPEDAH